MIRARLAAFAAFTAVAASTAFAASTVLAAEPRSAAAANGPARDASSRATIEVRVEGVELDALVLGEPFDLVVERSWSRSLEVQPLRVGQLAPLELVERIVEHSTADGDGTDASVEVRRYRAHLFEPGAVAIEGVEIVAHDRASGASVRAIAAPLVLTASNVLDADDDGRVEVPLELLGPRARERSVLVVLGAAAALAFVVVALLLRRRKAARVESIAVDDAVMVAPPSDLDGRLDALERSAREALDAEHDARWHTELWRVVRGVAAVRLRRSLEARTVTESAAAVRERVDLATGDEVGTVGHDCDSVRFGSNKSAPDERTRRVDEARRLARELDEEGPR